MGEQRMVLTSVGEQRVCSSDTSFLLPRSNYTAKFPYAQDPQLSCQSASEGRYRRVQAVVDISFQQPRMVVLHVFSLFFAWSCTAEFSFRYKFRFSDSLQQCVFQHTVFTS